MKAQSIYRGPDGDTYIKKAATVVGAPGDQAVAATKVLPFVSADQQHEYLTAGGGLTKAYKLTGEFLVDQGRTKTAPSDAVIADHIDGSYVDQAIKDGCDK
jgi:taurine transport system substrate-binding protein